jgi:hypothetical protein
MSFSDLDIQSKIQYFISEFKYNNDNIQKNIYSHFILFGTLIFDLKILTFNHIHYRIILSISNHLHP